MNTPVSGTASPQGPAVDPQPPVTGLPLPRLPRWQPFEWIVALRFLREGRTQSMFIIGGVAIGVAVIVFMSALLAGLQANFLRRALTGQPHVQLLPLKEVVRPLRGDDAVQGAIVQAPLQRLKSIDQWQALALQIRALPRVVAVSPVVTGSALVVRGDASRAISAVGVEPGSYFRIVAVDDKLVAGHARLSSNDILVGSKLAADLGVRVGDKLRVTAAGGADFTLAIGGIFDLGNKAANNRTAYMALRTAQSLLGLLGGVTALDVTVDDPYAAERVAQRITADTGVQADSWIKTNAEFFVAVNAQQSSNTLIRAFLALSVAMGIASVLVVSVVQRSREIGILRAMGVTRAQVLRLFLIQGGRLGLGGAVVGSALSAGALLLWQRLMRNADGKPLFPVSLEPALFATALALATVTGLIAAFAPALRAARFDPVVAIRG